MVGADGNVALGGGAFGAATGGDLGGAAFGDEDCCQKVVQDAFGDAFGVGLGEIVAALEGDMGKCWALPNGEGMCEIEARGAP